MATLYASGATDVLALSVNPVRADVTAYVAVRAGTVRVQLVMTEPVPVLGTLLGSPQGELVTATAAARTAVQ